jgi:hypothetical protein
MDFFDLLEDEKKPEKKVMPPLPKAEIPPQIPENVEIPVVKKEEPIRSTVPTLTFELYYKTYTYEDKEGRFTSRQVWEFEVAKSLVPTAVRDETAERIKLGKPFQKGEKSTAAFLMETYNERFSTYPENYRTEILSLIRKEAALSRSQIAKGIKEKVLNDAKKEYPVPERRVFKKREMAKGKSEKIGALELRLQMMSRDKISTAFTRELEIERRKKEPVPRTTSPDLKEYNLARIDVQPLPQPLHPKKGLIYNSLHHPYLTVKQQINALNKPTSFTESKLKYPVAQLIISLPNKVTVSEGQAVWMCHRHMARMGIDPTQHTYFIYKHTNTGLEHYHLVYNRVRLDGGVHHLPGANQVCHLESSVQDATFGIAVQIAALTGRDKFSRIVQSRLANGNHCAEIRYYKKPAVEVPVVGEEAYARIEQVGVCSLKTAGGGFAKHQLFHNASWLVKHVMQ